jgi:hypothetical protein
VPRSDLRAARRHALDRAIVRSAEGLLLLWAAVAPFGLALAFRRRRARRRAARREDMLAGVAYDLRDALAAQCAFADTLRHGRVQSPEQRAWCLDGISRASSRMARLVGHVSRVADAR